MGVKTFFANLAIACIFLAQLRLLMNGTIRHYKDVFCSLECPTEIVCSPIPLLARGILVSTV